MPQPASATPGTVTVHVPLAFRHGRGRKIIATPDGSPVQLAADRPRSALVKAIARAFRWRKLLETGVYSTIQDIAAAEKVNASYIGRVLRLTLLAPDIVEAILDGREATTVTIDAVLKPLPAEWAAQRHALPAVGHWNVRSAPLADIARITPAPVSPLAHPKRGRESGLMVSSTQFVYPAEQLFWTATSPTFSSAKTDGVR